MFTCEFCSKEFLTKGNLVQHQKTTKYCLELQGKIGEQVICNYCNKSFTMKSSLLKHYTICQIKKEQETSEYENKFFTENKKLQKEYENLEKVNEQMNSDNFKLKIENDLLKEQLNEHKKKIEKLENTIAKIAAKPRTTNNTINNQRYNQIIQNLSPITQETLDELPLKLEDRHISQGPHGYVVFVQENFQDKILCTDIARKKLTFKDEKNNIITDINGRQITYKIFKTIHGVRENLVEIKKSKAKTDLEKTQAVLYYGVEDAAIGKFLNMQEDSVFSNKFISELSSKFYIKNIPLSKNSELEELDENDIEYLVLSDGQE
jgi:hypothetical protein